MSKGILVTMCAVVLIAALGFVAPSITHGAPKATVVYPPDPPEGQGCCSWHGGQCGCSNGRVVCCDGVLSPTCTC